MRLPVRFSTVAVAAVAGFVIAALYIADRALTGAGDDHAMRLGLWISGGIVLVFLGLSVAHERRLIAADRRAIR